MYLAKSARLIAAQTTVGAPVWMLAMMMRLTVLFIRELRMGKRAVCSCAVINDGAGKKGGGRRAPTIHVMLAAMMMSVTRLPTSQNYSADIRYGGPGRQSAHREQRMEAHEILLRQIYLELGVAQAR